MKVDIIEEICANTAGRVLQSEPLRNHTTYRTGGTAELLACPDSRSESEWIYRFAKRNNLPLTVIGAGSNLVVSESGISGIVLKMKSPNGIIDFSNENFIVADASVYLDTLIKSAAARGLGGFNNIAGIPGTVGGAVVMNAGTGKGDVSDIIKRIQAITPDGDLIHLEPGEMGFGYRQSRFQERGWLILKVELQTVKVEPEKTLEEIDSIWKRRAESYPMEFASAGSVFRNPPGNHAGSLIEQAGCKGLQVGGAMVSDKHANFIINTGDASSDDIIQLIEKIRDRVYSKSGIELQLEQELIGYG